MKIINKNALGSSDLEKIYREVKIMKVKIRVRYLQCLVT